jgi:hypothetical protein
MMSAMDESPRPGPGTGEAEMLGLIRLSSLTPGRVERIGRIGRSQGWKA